MLIFSKLVQMKKYKIIFVSSSTSSHVLLITRICICRAIIFQPPKKGSKELKNYGEDKDKNNNNRNISVILQIWHIFL